VAGPTRQQTNSVIVPPGEGRKAYASASLAWFVENLEMEDDDCLKSVVGPSILRIGESVEVETSPPPSQSTVFVPDLSTGVTCEGANDLGSSFADFGFKAGSRPHSIFAANLMNGSVNTLIYRFGTRLFRFKGGVDEPDEVIESGLSSVENPRFPDQYVTIGNTIVWTNGVDHPRVMLYTGDVFDLGFKIKASTPSVAGPTQPDFDEIPQYFPNSVGYSWPGRIGTPGDVLAGREGSLLNGGWYYYFQFEDLFGNLSAFSSPSEPVSINSNQADPYVSVRNGKPRYIADTESAATFAYGGPRTEAAQGTEIDDLTRRFLVRFNGDAPENSVAVRVFRTPDTKHVGNDPQFLARVPGSGQFTFDDNKSDSELGLVWEETVETPVFRVACSHQGRLIVGNISGDPGAVRQSRPGLPGTFSKFDIVYPDAGGAEITGLVSHNGHLLAFTENATYAIGQDFKMAQPVSLGVGCMAPRSINALPDGTLMWLGRDGFYGMRSFGQIVRMSMPIEQSFKTDVNSSRMHMAVSVIDSETKEYRCALAKSGETHNRLMFCFDGKYWRRQTLGIHIADMCNSKDWRKYTFVAGLDPREKDLSLKAKFSGATNKDISTAVENRTHDYSRVFVLDRQTTDYFGPPRRIRYRSSWIQASENGLVPTNVRTLYVGLKDAWNGFATVRIYKNGSWKPFQEMKDLLLVGPDDESDVVNDIAGNAVYGESKVHRPRLFWRQVPVDLHNVNSWAFEIELIGWPSGMPLAASSIPSSVGKNDKSSYIDLFGSNKDGIESFNEKMQNPKSLELGRLRLAAFAFDVSIATMGSPFGRVPKRMDE